MSPLLPSPGVLRWFLVLGLGLLQLLPPAADRLQAETGVGTSQRVSLNGPWKFAADYQNLGDASRWFATDANDAVWDRVGVPHTWSHDPRFVGFIGAGWYRHRFTSPAVAEGEVVRLKFGAVFARARVWLDGELLGSHEGGYTPFEFDVTSRLKPGASHLLVVCAENRWDRSTIPGARGGAQPQEQVYAWWDDGGIIRDVDLLVTPSVYVTRLKVEATPDLSLRTATVQVRAWVKNTTRQPHRGRVVVALDRESKALPLPPVEREIEVSAGGESVAVLDFILPSDLLQLWSLDTPVLYQARVRLGSHTLEPVHFGFRRFEIRGDQFLLNGQVIRLAGANWHASHPDWGQDQPAAGVTRDLQLMKEAGLVFQRLTHYPVSPVILDWADRHGMLIIAEAGATGWTAEQLSSPVHQDTFRAQHRAMIERDWNHPSVVAWSVGNEFAADTPAGVRWVQEQRAFTHQLDATRPVTFVSNTVAKPGLKPAEEGSHYADFVCLNTYGRTPQANAANIDRVHALHPNKPLLITEYGLRHDFVGDETERVDWFRAMLAIIRERPFVSGASVWSFNDYRSRYVGTNPNGWREWGLVAGDRTPRGAYHALRREHSGFVLRQANLQAGVLTARFEAQTEFPVFPAATCEVRAHFFDGQNRLLGTATVPLVSGSPLKIPATAGASAYRLEIWRGGFATASFGSNLVP